MDIPHANIMRSRVQSILKDENSVASFAEEHLQDIVRFITLSTEDASSTYEHRFVISRYSALEKQIVQYVEKVLREKGYGIHVYYDAGFRIIIKWY